MKKPIISPDQSLTFADYFKLNISAEDAANYFGYDYEKTLLELPRSTEYVNRNSKLVENLQRNVLRVDLTGETARREFLIAPVLSELFELTETRIRVEYAIEVSHQLKGSFDYLLKNKNNFLLLEAKNADLVRGFVQLAVEMIAFDRAEETAQNLIFGAVSIGDIWRFGVLNRNAKRIYEDTSLFRVPADVEDLLKILIGVLENEN